MLGHDHVICEQLNAQPLLVTTEVLSQNLLCINLVSFTILLMWRRIAWAAGQDVKPCADLCWPIVTHAQSLLRQAGVSSSNILSK